MIFSLNSKKLLITLCFVFESKNFIKFILSESGQKILLKKNYMLPVISQPIVSVFLDRLPKLKNKSFEDFERFQESKEGHLIRWKESLK